MAFPAGWPPRPSSGNRNIHAFLEGTADSSYENNAYLFFDLPGASGLDPTPYVAPGTDEKLATPLGNNRSPLPYGTGQEARDARPFNPDIFLRGTGTASSDTTFTQSGAVTTYYDASGPFHRGHLNREIRFADSTSAGNDGTFVISEVVDARTIRYTNVSGVTEDQPVAGTWRLRQYQEAVAHPMIWSSTVRVQNLGANAIYISFDGVNDANYIPAGEYRDYRGMGEAGIALRTDSGTSDFVLEAW